MLRRHFINIYNHNNQGSVDLTLPYVTFIALEPGGTISLTKKSNYHTLQWSLDKESWKSFTTSTIIQLNNIGDKVYIRGKLSRAHASTRYTQFNINEGLIAAVGNCGALWNYSNMESINAYCGFRLFCMCDSLVYAPSLPATTLSGEYCYAEMFYGCDNLIQAPQLPATTLTNYCYHKMFGHCKSLIVTPELPALKIYGSSYMYMFFSCTSITTVSPILATTAFTSACEYMFQNCVNLQIVPTLCLTDLRKRACFGMFQGCTSLIESPILKLATLDSNCCAYMFCDCINLNKVTCLVPSSDSTLHATVMWLDNVSSSGTFIKTSQSVWEIGSNGIPEGWTVQDYVE